MWRGEVVPPREWRKGKRPSGGREQQPGERAADGVVKGNIGKNCTRIHHVAGGRYYGQTRINTSKRERWFCSENQARAAG